MHSLIVTAKEWFDKINGNSYFAAQILVDFGYKSEAIYLVPFEYGYGDYYLQATFNKLETYYPHLFTPESRSSLWAVCFDHKIALKTLKIQNCKKREVIGWTKGYNAQNNR